MGSRTDKPQPDRDIPQNQKGQRVRVVFSVPVSETLPIAQEPAQPPEQPSQLPEQPTNEDPSQTPPSEEAAESNS